MYSICSTCGKDDFDTKGKIFFTRSNTKVSVCQQPRPKGRGLQKPS